MFSLGGYIMCNAFSHTDPTGNVAFRIRSVADHVNTIIICILVVSAYVVNIILNTYV
jgi:hypothetical protein